MIGNDDAEAALRFDPGFPRLQTADFKVTSPHDPAYNCIAWAADDDEAWWWPRAESDAYWPDQAPLEETVEAFVTAYGTLGYEVCPDGALETTHEKIAIFVDNSDTPTHAARQLADGRWTSKLGMFHDIEHELVDVEGPLYGKVGQYMKRPRRTNDDSTD